jgi:hypothetical protein
MILSARRGLLRKEGQPGWLRADLVRRLGGRTVLKRYTHIWRTAGLAGVLTAAAIAVAAAPAGATLICPPGTHNPKYCTNVLPIGVTSDASNLGSTTATLNGVSGPGIPNGDVTSFFFQYGLSSATYGTNTAPGTVGVCPKGVGKPPYCSGVPAAEDVSADVGNLAPCTTYHYRIVSTNKDGTTIGNDKVFTTAFGNPVKSVKLQPGRVKHGKKFKVTITLTLAAHVKIFLRNTSKDLKSFDLGFHNPGTVTKTVKAPKKKGHYTVRIVAATSCGKQTVNKLLRVH